MTGLTLRPRPRSSSRWGAAGAGRGAAPGLGLGRDLQRMPMPWETTPSHAGFMPDDVEPWLPTHTSVATARTHSSWR
ncbi:hypothetical protein AB0J35_36480 [Nonomuraea angiospora]|uniref:hypothetical protein n=1 Tax=Nonomuraea angiospora TaxID=46172 RepID=UPI00343ED050